MRSNSTSVIDRRHVSVWARDVPPMCLDRIDLSQRPALGFKHCSPKRPHSSSSKCFLHAGCAGATQWSLHWLTTGDPLLCRCRLRRLPAFLHSNTGPPLLDASFDEACVSDSGTDSQSFLISWIFSLTIHQTGQSCGFPFPLHNFLRPVYRGP